MNLKILFDGACGPRNPGGHIGIGWVANGSSHHEYRAQNESNTNNIAEYLAVIRALDHAVAHPEFSQVVIAGDSQLVICQLSGDWSVNSPNLHDHFREARAKLEKLQGRGTRVTLLWVPREENEAADSASKQALEEHGVEPLLHIDKKLYTKRLSDLLPDVTIKGKQISGFRVGKLLAQAGLRTDGIATELAVAARLAVVTESFFGRETWWNKQAVAERLKEMLLLDSRLLNNDYCSPSGR